MTDSTGDKGKEGEHNDKRPKPFHIQIDRVKYEAEQEKMTGAELRQLASIGADRDLFEVVPGHPDRKLADTDVVEIKNGKRFFTAPAHINPGRTGNHA